MLFCFKIGKDALLFQNTTLNFTVSLIQCLVCNDFPQEVLYVVVIIHCNQDNLLITYQLSLMKQKGLFDMLFGISNGVLVNV